ncbi:MAG TPA: nuclear transport factor 2 family protein [Kofleriaceae bacterium]|nr:nuclear transport factor 2 family protein [Kofleriaceae bacterium]
MRSTALTVAFVCMSSVVGADNTDIATRAIAARAKTMQATTTAADVDAFVAFMADDVVYEDPVVHMRIEGKAKIRDGMLGFLGATRSGKIAITKQIAAASVVVLDQTVSFEERDGGTSIPRSRHQVTILELDSSGKIHRLADYWAR